MKKDISTATIHIFYDEEHPNGYTISTSSREACNVARELCHRTGSPVSVGGGLKRWQDGKYAFWIITIDQPFREQLQDGYVVHTSIN